MGTTAATPSTGEGAAKRAPSWRSVALPVEHGGWSLLAEPLVLGLLVAPSAAGAWVAAGTAAAFLARHPFRLVAFDRRKGFRYPRTRLAERFFGVYAAASALAFAAALSESNTSILIPLAVAAPAGLCALWLDLQSRGREALPESAGALALGSSATAIILAGGGAPAVGWAAWALLAARSITAIFYVRARVRLDRDPTRAARARLAWPVLTLHALVAATAFAAQARALTSPIAASAFVLLLLRAAFGLAPGRKPIRPQALGLQEVLVGLACLALFAFGLAPDRGR